MTPQSFVIESGPMTEAVVGRAEAVARATLLSQRTWRPVRLTRSDELVQMQFRSGALQEYRFNMRRR